MTSTSTDAWVSIGEGFPYVPRDERAGERFGAIALTDSRSGEGQPVQFDDAPVDQHGWLIAEALDGPRAAHTFVLGQGTLYTSNEPGYPVIGLVPDDGRAECWLDPAELYQVDERLVRLLFVPDGEAQ